MDYAVNSTGNVLLIVWDLAQEGVDYFVYVQSIKGELHTWVLPTAGFKFLTHLLGCWIS